VRPGPYSEEGFRHSLVGARGSPQTEACDHPGGIDRPEQAKALLPSQTVGPPDVGLSGQPSMPPALGISNGHRRTIQSLVGGGLASGIGHHCQMHGQSLDELHIGTHQPVELGALGQGREGVSEVACGVAVEVPFAGESGEAGEDGKGNDLAFAEGRIGTGSPFWWLGVAEIVCDET
jgi:hypothetical protein